MKKMKKLASIALALVMTLALALPAFADEPATITIENASKGATYTVYKLFDAKVNGTGGITYTGTIPASLNSYFEIVNGDQVQMKQDADQAALFAALADWAKTAAETDHKVAQGGPLTFNVPYGYYVITSTIGGGTAVTVDSTNPNASVYDKNSAGVPIFPGDAKTADDDIFHLGETVTYTVKLNTVNWVGADTNAKKVTSYTIKDTATAGYLENVTVTSIKVGGTEIGVQQFNANGEITIPWVNDAGESLYNNAAAIEITYTATVVGIGAGENKVTATYKAGETDNEVEGEPEETIYNAKMTVTKVDGTGAALPGAGFVLQKDGKYYKKADDNKSISWVETTAEATELMSTSESNVMVFDGLDEGTYTLIEKTVPAGYNKAADVTFTVEDNNVTVANLEQAATVTNNAGQELPSTGGMGTTLFTTFGGLLMIGAAMLFVAKKRSIA